MAAEIAEREGCRLYDVEIAGSGSSRTVRVYIDKLGDSAGNVAQPGSTDLGLRVGIEDCTNVSRALNLRLDVEDIISGGAYVLEVSSPCLERSLREPWHFQGVLGQTIWIKMSTPLLIGSMTCKQLKGELLAVTEDGIRIKSEAGDSEILYRNIEKAKTIFDYARESQAKPTRMQGKSAKKSSRKGKKR